MNFNSAIIVKPISLNNKILTKKISLTNNVLIPKAPIVLNFYLAFNKYKKARKGKSIELKSIKLKYGFVENLD